MSEGNEPIRDPDYELSEAAKYQKKLRDDTEKKQMINKIRNIIKREFQKELDFREKQLEIIQQRLNKAAKSLHLLRYCLVTSYYNKSEYQISSNNEEFPTIDKQSRIHPAVKRLLGNNSSNVYSSLGLRKKKHRETNAQETIDDPANVSKEEKVVDVNIKIEPKDDNLIDIPKNVNLIRNRKLYKHQIVIGNISKWAPSQSPEDSSTHKWMVYIRGPKEYPDISHIVQRVAFYLHPSYKPNDVIEVTKSPFHLSRRGWGEFPLRVQLFFHGELNKPVDVIHNLKLDRTRTGRQTLGNETIIELSLYDMNKGDAIRKRNGFCNQTETIDALPIKQEILEQVIEHVMPEKMVENTSSSDNISYIDLDHNYCQRNNRNVPEVSEVECEKVTELKNVVQNGDLVGARIKRRLSFPPSLSTSLNKRIKTEFFEDSSSENVSMERYEINLESYRLRNLDQALTVLFKKLPLITEVANHNNYKWMYPFTASSIREFTKWNVVKQFSSEWARSRLIRKILVTSKFPGSQSLTTKNILQYGRAHGFSFPATHDIYSSLHNVTFNYSHCKSDCEYDTSRNFEQETHVDVINNCGNKPKREDGILIRWTDNFKHERSYVKQTALDVGILLKQEQIVPGVLYSTSERIIYECTKSFAEDLIRRSLSWAATNERFNNDSLLVPSHIIEGLHHRQEYEKILSFNKDSFQY